MNANVDNDLKSLFYKVIQLSLNKFRLFSSDIIWMPSTTEHLISSERKKNKFNSCDLCKGRFGSERHCGPGIMTQKGQKINFIRKLYRPQKVKGQRKKKSKNFFRFCRNDEKKQKKIFLFTFSSESKILYSFRSAAHIEGERREISDSFQWTQQTHKKDVNAPLLSLPFCLSRDNDEV